MRRVVNVVLLVSAVLIAVTRAVIRRLRVGPTVPGWSWAMDLRRAALSALIGEAIRQAESGTFERLVAPDLPLPRRLRGSVDFEPAVSGAVRGEWIRVRAADLSGPVLLYLHGGGYVMGSPAMERAFIAAIAVEAGAPDVFSADYRLAPEHVFPAALEDATAAYLGMLDGGVDPRRLVVVGDSAGGGLALSLLVSLRDAGHPLPAGAVLFSPWVDLTNGSDTFLSNAASDYLPAMHLRAAVEYLGEADPATPTASPLHADLSGLPPLLVLAGGREMILADSTRLAERAGSAGVDVELVVEADMFHVWPVVVPTHPASLAAIDRAARWIRLRTRQGGGAV